MQGVNRLKHREPLWVGEKDSFSGCKAEAVITELGAESPEVREARMERGWHDQCSAM